MNKHNLHIDFDYGKIPPQAIELEEAVLGSLLLESKSFNKIADILRVHDFYRDEHQKIFSAMSDMYLNNQAIDIITVTEELRNRKEIDEIGGALYVTQLSSRVASSAHLEFHSKILKQKSVKRMIISKSMQMINSAYDDSSNLSDVIDLLNKETEEINRELINSNTLSHISIGVKESTKEMKQRERLAKDGKMVGIKTPFRKLDELTTGWKPTDLIIIASRPSFGKTGLALAIAKIAAKENNAVCIISKEMPKKRLTDRLILSESDINPGKFRSGLLNDQDWVLFNKAAKKIEKLPIWIDDNPYSTVTYIKSRLRILKNEKKLDLVIIDYLQLISVNDIRQRNKNREQEIAQISSSLKEIAKELNIPIILLSQLNRLVEQRSNPKPKLSDLRESGSPEQDADLVILLNRPEKYGIRTYDDGTPTKNIAELILAKHRDGPTGEFKFEHNTSLTRFWDYVKKDKQKTEYSGQQKLLIKDLDNDSGDDLPF